MSLAMRQGVSTASAAAGEKVAGGEAEATLYEGERLAQLSVGLEGAMKVYGAGVVVSAHTTAFYEDGDRAAFDRVFDERVAWMLAAMDRQAAKLSAMLGEVRAADPRVPSSWLPSGARPAPTPNAQVVSQNPIPVQNPLFQVPAAPTVQAQVLPQVPPLPWPR